MFLEDVKRYFRITPAMPIMLSLMAGIISPWLFIVPLALLFFARNKWYVILFFAFGLFFAHIPIAPYKKYLRHPETEATIRAIVIEQPSENWKRPRAAIRITHIKKDGRWLKTNGKAQGVFSEPIPCDTRIEANGAFVNLPPSKYNDWLFSKGIQQQFYAREVIVESMPAISLNSIREGLIQRLNYGLQSHAARGMLAAMIFGSRSDLPRDVSNAFIKSATIHIFSISGLHVGLIFACLFLAVRLFGCPYRIAIAVILPFLAFYVLLCGGMPSALRAFFMLLVVSLTELQNRTRSPENALAVASIALLCINPLYLRHIGFIYSFTLVAVLLKSAPVCNAIAQNLTEKQWWLPRNKRLKYRMAERTLQMLFGCIAAWLGCTGLMMHFNQFISFASIALNLVMLPAATLLVAGALLKLVFNTLFLAHFLEWMLLSLQKLSQIGASKGLFIQGATISLALLALYYVALLLILIRIPLKIKTIAAITICCIILKFAFFKPTNLTITSGNSDERLNSTAVVNEYSQTDFLVGGYSSMNALANHLKSLGITEIDTLYVPPKTDVFTLEKTLEQLPPKQIAFSPAAIGNRRIQMVAQALNNTNIHIIIDDPPYPLKSTPTWLPQPIVLQREEN